MKVEFLIVGVQKAGTTALRQFLLSHPALALSHQKEVHFFDNESVDWTTPDYGAYHAAFSPGLGQKVGEVTPIYSYWPPAPKRIKSYNPNMKLVMCLRDPVKRAYSHWEMEVSRRWDNLKFHAAIRKGRDRVVMHGNSQYGCHRIFSYVERGFYSDQIKRLLELFPANQIMFLENASMRDNQHDTLNKVCDFIGVERFTHYPANEDILPTRKRHDLGRISNEDASYLSDLYREDTSETATLTGLDLSHWLSWRD